MKKVWFMLAMMVCIFASCSDGGGEEPITPTPKPEEVKTEITIDSGIISNGLSFSSAEGEQSVSFSVNADWTLSIASTTSGTTWCKASATSGSKGTANVKFTVSENTDYEDRSVSVTIKAGTVSKTFTITQKGADAMLVTTTKYEVAQEGGQIEIEVKANIDYKMEISEEAKDWIKESSGRALTTYKHKLDIAMNEDAEKREGEITFKSGDKVETVKVYQAGGAILLLSQNDYNVSDKGDTVSVDIKSNIDFGVQMPDVDWIIDEASSRGLSSHTLKYVVMANEGYDGRSAEIIFYDKNSDLKDTLKVAQAQKDAILLNEKYIEVDSKGGEVKVKLKSNIDYDVVSNVSWIKLSSKARGLNECLINLSVDENLDEDVRLGKVILINNENNVSDTLTLNQKGYKVIVHLEKPGTLKKILGENLLDIKSLKIIGAINGDDIFCLRKLLGGAEFDKNSRGILFKLDLLESAIVEGGEWYYTHSNAQTKYYTNDNTIGKYMFSECKNLKYIILPEKTQIIDDYAFWVCTSLSDVFIPDVVTTLGENSFGSCTSIREFIFPRDVKTVGWNVFANCFNLEKIELNKKLTSISQGMLWTCKSLKKIIIPDNVVNIDRVAFSKCALLESVSIGNGATKIGDEVFADCTKLKKIILGENVEIIGVDAFKNVPIEEFYSFATLPPSICNELNKRYSFSKKSIKTDATLYVPKDCVNAYKKSDWGQFFRSVEQIE